MAGFYNLIDEANFKKPDMGEYYDENLMEEFLSQVDSNSPKNAAYYVEEPFSTRLGYHKEYEAFVIYAKPMTKFYYKEEGQYNEDMNNIDGDTVYFDLNSVNDGGMPFEINGGRYTGFKHYCFNKMDSSDYRQGIFKIRSVGVDAPEIPHYSVITVKKEDANKLIKYYTKEEIEKYHSSLIYEKNKNRVSGEEYPFIYKNEDKKGKLYEIVDTGYSKDVFSNTLEGKSLSNAINKMLSNKELSEKPNYICMKIVSTDKQTESDMNGEVNMGILAKDIMIETLAKAEDIRIVVDAKQLIYEQGFAGVYEKLGEGLTDDQNVWDLVKAFYTKCFGENLFKYPGFTTFGQDTYKRFLGAIYVKMKAGDSQESVWINVNKYLISQLGEYMQLKLGLSPRAQANGNGVSDAFNVWSYDNSRSIIADGFYKISESDFDDRREIQREITGLDFSTYKDYTVMIGDCLFMVPPTSIRVVNQIDSERVNLLRSKGSMTKTKPHTDRILELTLYFNEDEGINGVPIKRQLPSQKGTDETVTYYMNGLRSLIAMFKYTPFLPIENSYINDTLGIEAVSLANLQIQTMPMYPKCIAATLTLQQFNYRVYLNELPVPSPADGEHYTKNMFASTINYEVMRYYYQRAILNGEKIKSLDPTSDEFIEATMGSKTCLIPTHFKDQRIQFSILDKNWLDKMLEIKELAEKRPLQQTQAINEATTSWAYSIGKGLSLLLEELRTIKIKANDDSLEVKLNNKFINSQKCPYLISIKVTFDTVIKSSGTIDCYFDISSITKEERLNLMTAIYKELGLESNEVTIFMDGHFKFDIVSANKENTSLKVSTSGDMWKVAEFFAFRSTGLGGGNVEIDHENWNDFSQSSNEQFFQDMKDNAIDIETYNSAKFVQYPLDDIIAQQFSITMGNVLANTKLKAQDGYAPQFAGGQDTIIDFVFHTTNEETVGLLNAMQQMAADQLITYRKVISCWPIRINSEMTRLCGINEVAIESIDITTVPMHPGLFAIQVRAISVDRTMRNKESLRKIDNMNNSGSINSDGISGHVSKTYFDLKNTLSKAEIYPDLELPTIQELEENGFKYIRYMKQKNSRTYPDPDFYFVYGFVYSSQMLRKTIIDYFEEKNGANGENLGIEIEKSNFAFSDSTSHQLSIMSLDKDNRDTNVIKFEHTDKEIDSAYAKSLKEAKSKVNAVLNSKKEDDKKSKTIKEVAKNLNTVAEIDKQLLSFNVPSWDVCEKIKCTFSDSKSVSDIEDGAEIKNSIDDVSQKIIKDIDKLLSKPIKKSSKWKHIDSYKYKDSHTALVDALKQYIKDYDSDDNTMAIWKKMFSYLGRTSLNDTQFKNVLAGTLEACAMAMSGASEYYENAPKEEYQSKAYFYRRVYKTDLNSGKLVQKPTIEEVYAPYSLIQDKNTGEVFCATSNEEAFKYGFTFGPYQIRKYDPEFLYNFHSALDYTFTERDFLDPYYNKTINKNVDQKEYMENLITCPRYAIEAFCRITLIWMKDMINRGIFLNIFDTQRSKIANTLSEIMEKKDSSSQGIYDDGVGNVYTEDSMSNKQNDYYYDGGIHSNYDSYNAVKEKNPNQQELNAIADYAKDVKSSVSWYENELANGKIFMAMCAAVTHGDSVIYGDMINKDIGSLYARTRECQTAMDVEQNLTDGERTFRKLIRGLSATKFNVTKIVKIGSKSNSKLDKVAKDKYARLWVEASQDPSLWVLHSFYDMIVHDKRGRMARAFPTYYMLLVDEGREIGFWKIHDNFYNITAISEIEVTRSRKIPADTARIVMTNMFKTFTTEDEEIKTDYEHNIKDVFNSIFSPRIYFQEAEQKRTEQMNVNRITLRPGARVHLRMGYSGDASELPIVFNGVIAEVNPGEVMEIIAQGDGHEITNPGVFDGLTASNLADVQNEASGLKWIANFFNNGASPKQLIKNMFTTKGGIFKRLINSVTNGRLFNDNAFGITHFGEIDYKDIHPDGEIMQNIYEGEGSMPWHEFPDEGTKAAEYTAPTPPAFTIKNEGKSVWDMMNICASASSEFIAGITTFGLRSTLFHGRPHYYYAYDYDITDYGTVVEKRKPYQQYHIIDSFSDIIGNNIKASAKDVKTVAIASYVGEGWRANEVIRTTKPLYVDWDIYPEYQKTVTVDTQMQWDGKVWGELIINSMLDKWNAEGGKKIAWRMAAKYLKESMKDMYQGEVICLGDPTIKPLDRCFIHDIYEDMSGAFDVEAVVHRITPETGFTTSIYADCISTVDSRFDEIGRAWSTQIAGQVATAKLALYFNHKIFGTSTKPMLTYIAKTVNKGAYATMSGLNKAANIIGKDDLIKYTQMEEWSETFYKAVGIKSSEVAVWSKLDNFKNWKNLLGKFDIQDASTAKEMIEALGGIIKVAEGTGPQEIASALEQALSDGNIKSNKVDDITKAINDLKKLNINSAEITSTITSIADDAVEQLLKLEKAGSLTSKQKDALKALQKIDVKDMKSASKALDALDSVSDVIKISNGADVAKAITKYGDDVAKIMKSTDKIIDAAKVTKGLLVGAGAAATLPVTVALIAAEMAIEYVLAKTTYDWIESTMASFNVLTIHPLKKNGVALVAGIDGHKGLVVGSPTWEKDGPIDSFIKWVFKDREGMLDDFVRNFIFSEEMNRIAATYTKENKSEDVNYSKEETLQGLLEEMAESTASNHSAYKAMALSKRITDLRSSEAKATYNNTRVLKANGPIVCEELIPITPDNEILEQYFKDKLLTTAHTMDTNDKKINYSIKHKAYKDKIKYKGIVDQNKDGVIDIPFLRPDAFQVLNRFLEIVNLRTKLSSYGEDNSVNIYLTSGTRVADNTWSATGYVFRIQTPNFTETEEVFEEMKQEFAEIFANSNAEAQHGIFNYQKIGDSWDVFIAPRNKYFIAE